MRRNRWSLPIAVVILAASLSTPQMLVAESAAPGGHWEGAIEIPGQSLEVEIDLALEADVWSGKISIPAQGATDLPLESISVSEKEVSFSISGIPGEPTFRGTLSDDGSSLGGDFTQAGQSFPFTLTSGIDLAARTATALDEIDATIEAALEDWNTPGLGLAVIAGDQVVLAKGFGDRDIENGLPVTERTLFAIGSSTKAFTTFAMGLLVDEGKLDWDEPVASYLDGFRLYDEYATAHLTPRDMVTHRSGLPRHDLTWYNNENITRAEIVGRLAHLQPNKELRETWQYNNLMFLTSGYLVEQLTGRTWEDAMRESILAPLGMTRTNFSVADSQEDDDFAQPYVEEDDVLRKVAFRPLNVIGPAGSINSSVEEMAKWVRVHLSGGKVDGEQIIGAGTLAEIHSPQMVIPGMPDDPQESPSCYAFGWFTDTWRGHYRVSHGGNIDGFSALVTLFPEARLGVVVLVNKGGSPLPSLVTKTVSDRILELESMDWIGDAAEKRDAGKEFGEQGEKNKDLFRVKDTRPSRDLKSFAGEYEHPGYGVLEIREASDGLTMVYNAMTMPLEHWHFDVFNVAESDEELIPEDLRVNFLTDARGRVSRLSVPFELFVDPIVFDRLLDRRLQDPEYLARMTGDYAVPNQTITVTLKGNVLVVEIPGQPELELVPAETDEFTLEGLTGFSVKFTIADEGPATEAVFIQPNGVFPAERVEE